MSSGPRAGFPRGLHAPIFFGAGGTVGASEVTIQQSQAAPGAQAQKPEPNRVYVPPRWVDGGYGVQILVPGYWSEPASTR